MKRTLLLTLLTVMACEPAPEPEKPKRGAPAAAWSSRVLSLKGDLGKVTVVMSKGELRPPMTFRAIFEGFAKGTKARIGDKAIDVPGKADVDFEAHAAIAGVNLSDALRKDVTLDVPLRIELPGFKAIETKVPPLNVESSLAYALAGAASGPVSFPGDAKGPEDTAAVVGPPSADREVRVLGPGKTARDIDWVALEIRGAVKKEKRCHKYKNRRDVVLKRHASTVEIFKRKSGESVAKRDFLAEDVCPKVPLMDADGSTHGYPSATAIDAWVRTKLGIPAPKKATPGVKK